LSAVDNGGDDATRQAVHPGLLQHQAGDGSVRHATCVEVVTGLAGERDVVADRRSVIGLKGDADRISWEWCFCR